MVDVGNIIQVSPAILYVLPIVIGLCQLLKTYKYVPSRWIPAAAIVMGVLGAFLLTDLNWQNTLVQGLALGLMAVGAFNSVRTTATG